MIPAATIIGLLFDPHDPRAEMQASDMRTAARALGLQVHLVNASTEGEIDSALAKLAQQRAGALIVGTGEFFNKRSEQIVALAARHALPAIYQYRLFAVAGGLATYGTRLTDSYRQAGVYTGRVLKGEKPADMPGFGNRPSSSPPKEFLNLKTAKALGLTVPPGVLAICRRGDRVKGREFIVRFC